MYTDLIYSIHHPISSLLIDMYKSGQDSKDIFITNEQSFFKTKLALSHVVLEKYISVSRRGSKATIKILAKAKKEIELEKKQARN